MHPVIKIVTTLLFCVMATAHTSLSMLAVLALVLIAYALGPIEYLRDAMSMARRLRWFFISILLVFFWFTPGHPLMAGAPHWLPSQEGVLLGLQRMLSLLTALLTVNLLVKTTRIEELASAIVWLCAPLALLGIPRERIAVRIALTLHAVTDVQAMLNDVKQQWAESGSRFSSLQAVGNGLGEIYHQILSRADAMQPRRLSLPVSYTPPLLQWLFFPAFAGLFWLVNLV